MDKREFRVLPPGFIHDWLQATEGHVRVDTYRDVLPGDWAAYMMPGLVHWHATDLHEDRGRYLVQNVNYGGNIVGGFTDFVTAALAVDAVRKVQLILVPLDRLGTRGLVDHAMLRFEFEPDHRLRLTPCPGGDKQLEATDFLVSWEAWRPPGYRFNLLEGFKPDAFRLIPRFYVAAHRFLEDAVKGRSWNCYDLTPSGGETGRSEILQMALTLADSVSRETLAGILADLDHKLDETAMEGVEIPCDNLSPHQARTTNRQDWDAIAASLKRNKLPRSPIDDMPHIYTSYQLLLRSCATMALHTIELAAKRLAAHGYMKDSEVAVLENLEIVKPVPWLEAMGRSGLKSIVRQAPFAIWWITRHQEVIPTKIPGILAKAGLVETRNGAPVVRSYFSGGRSLYIDKDDFNSD